MTDKEKQRVLEISNDHDYRTTIARLLNDALDYKNSEYNESVAVLIEVLKENKDAEVITKESKLPMLLSILAMTTSILSMVFLFLS